MPPMSWLRAVLSLMIRPASKTPSIRDTRASRVHLCTRTSQNWAPHELNECFVNSSPGAEKPVAEIDVRPTVRSSSPKRIARPPAIT